MQDDPSASPDRYAVLCLRRDRAVDRAGQPEDLTAGGELPRDAEAEAPAESDAGLEKVVRQALERLPENQREVIVLHRFEGMSMSEIADALGASESAVKVRAHRGYEKLREWLRGVWEEL